MTTSSIDTHKSFEQLLRLRLVNICALLALSSTLPYLVSYVDSNSLLAAFTFLCTIAFAFTWLMNKLDFPQAAKRNLYLFSVFYLFIASSTLGREAGIHFMFMPVLISAILVFEFNEKAWLGTIIILSLLSIIVLEITNYSLFKISVNASTLSFYYYGSLFTAFTASIFIAFYYYSLFFTQLKEKKEQIQKSQEIELIIQYFSNSMDSKNSVEAVLWDVTKNCISKLGLVDCVVYLLDHERNVLVQKAAYGSKNPIEFEIYQPIEIPLGQGIVGHVAQIGEAVIVNDTSMDQRYILDDQMRYSELSVPLLLKDKVIGVIDSEHPQKNFFTERHLSILRIIAELCVNKIRTINADQTSSILKVQEDTSIILHHTNLAVVLETDNGTPQKTLKLNNDEVLIRRLKSILLQSITDENFGVNQLAKEIGMSRMNLHRKLIALTGESTSTFIRKNRLAHAAQLLSSGENVSQAAYASGFSSLSYFSKEFKNQFGVLPSAYAATKK